MKETEEILQFIAYRIGHIYFRPLMSGGTAAGVDLMLHVYHEMWAEIYDQQECYERISRNIHAQQECGSANFSTRYGLNHPTSSEIERAAYAVEQWRKISKLMDIPVPYTAIRAEFKERGIFKDLLLDEKETEPKR